MTLGPADHADGEHEAQKLDAQEDGDHQSGEGQLAKVPATCKPGCAGWQSADSKNDADGQAPSDWQAAKQEPACGASSTHIVVIHAQHSVYWYIIGTSRQQLRSLPAGTR